MHTLIYLLAATPGPGATPAAVNLTTWAHNFEMFALQVLGFVFFVVTAVLGIHGLVKRRLLEVVVSLSLAALCGIFVFAPQVIAGLPQAIVSIGQG